MQRTPFRLSICLLPIAATLIAACDQEAAPFPDDLLAGDQQFVAVPRASSDDVVQARSALTTGPGAMGVQPGENNFYLAIRKDVLDQPWFLSGYLKQGQDRIPYVELPFFTLGTRVVSFKVQNDKLFVFDASGQRTASAVIDPPNVLEAYPVIDLPDFNRLRNADRYVVIDPSAGLNPFGITSDLFEDQPQRGLSPQGAAGDIRLRVGIAFMQNFRQLADGVTFDEIFTGDIAGVDPAPFTVWGTLGLTFRRYSVGDGFKPTPAPVDPLYFTTGGRLIPDSGVYNASYATPVKWNFHPGMSPVKVYVGAGATRAQADFPNVDVLGAFKRGIEGWNDVFGFRVFEAVFVQDDAIRDDDKTFVLVDYPGSGMPYAFADFRSNPINGETRGASVFFSGIFFSTFDYLADDPPAGGSPASLVPAGRAPSKAQALPARLPLVGWAGMAARPACVYPAHAGAAGAGLAHALAKPGPGALTASQKNANYIQHAITHEFGHILGLRHNFAGSLEPPTSSVMDYTHEEIDAHAPGPGPYDVEAVRYLYGLSATLPTHPFCTDSDVPFSPLCQRNDWGADPLFDNKAPVYNLLVSLILDGVVPADDPDYGWWTDWYLNGVLAFARDPGTVDPAERTAAVTIAFDRMGAPMSAADLASPAVVARANVLAEQVLRRIALDDPSLRGDMNIDVSDPDVVALVAAQAGRMLRNEDGVRPPPLRRTAVDVLAKLQSDSALLELAASRDAIQAALAGGQIPTAERPFIEDILARAERALTPYFN